MTENSLPDVKVDRTNSNSDGPGPLAATSTGNNSSSASAQPRQKEVRVAVIKLSDLRARELTEEEKAEENRRLKEIRAGRHPDTGERLRPGDRKTLKPREVWELQMQRDANLMRIKARSERSMIEAIEQQRVINMAIYGTSFPNDFHRAMQDHQKHLSVDPLLDDPSIRDQLHGFQARQALMDASFGNMANEHYDQTAEIDRQSRFLDSLLDPDFVNRITGGVSSDLMRRAIDLHDPLALRTLRETVDRAATARISEYWKFASVPLWSSTLAKEAAAGFGQDIGIMAREAERMISIYGPSIAEQTYFLSEYQSNLGLFQPSGLNAGAFEGADLLARIALPTHLLPGFEDYRLIRVERLQDYARAQLVELEDDFEREPNPLFVWEAFGIAQSCGLELPEWVLHHLSDVADNIRDIGEEDQAERSLTEAELVGKALGFSMGGKGQTGRFAHAKKVQRDKAIYFRVVEWLSEQRARNPKAPPKLSSAYAEIAGEFNVDASTIGKAYRRLKDYASDDEETDI